MWIITCICEQYDKNVFYVGRYKISDEINNMYIFVYYVIQGLTHHQLL